MAVVPTKTKNTRIFMLKAKTEPNGFGILKTLIVAFLIALQTALLILSYSYLLSAFKYYGYIAMVFTIFSCIHALSSTSNGQTKATWIMFLLICYSFGYVIYFLSNEKILFARARKKYNKIYKKTEKFEINYEKLQKKSIFLENYNNLPPLVKSNCLYLINNANIKNMFNSKINYFSNGTNFFDDFLEEIKKAKKFIFIEFYIISDGVLLKRTLDILKQKAQNGVDVRIIYDDMGSHAKIKRKTKKEIKNSGIKFMHFNRLVPIFNLALNLRDHRKIISIDGKIAYTGGMNLADEYINEKQIYGYWKDAGAKIEGPSVDNLTIAFLRQWEFVTQENVYYENYINLSKNQESEGAVIPFVSGPEFRYSIARDMYINIISSAEKKLNIMTPYFIPEETIVNLLITKAKSGVEVNLILPGIADKKYVYVVSRDYAERLIASGVNVYTMNNSFVHAKVMANENSAIIGSINVDHRSFNQQFESAIYTNNSNVLEQIENDFDDTIKKSTIITPEKRKRNKIFYRIFAGLFRLVSPFM